MFNENDKKRFLALWKELGGKEEDGPGVFTAVNALYANPQRRYYTAGRIQNFLAELDEVRHHIENPALVEAAVMLSNVIHNLRLSNGSELSSASFARDLLYCSGISDVHAEGVYNLIVATRDPFITPEHGDTKILLDIILSPLGVPSEKFDENTRLLREEYPWESEEVFMKYQANQVHAFLQHPPIFRTEHFNRKYGERATDNIMRLCGNAITL
ncbi:hypothetical protein HY839_03025 [Candidatus Azambacteria bacterium]|nr:hypothetical protein [Candidatus Azambacteria bacterium]